MSLKRKLIQLLLVYLPMMTIVFVGYYIEGYESSDILGMIFIATVLAVVLMAWIAFVADNF